MLALRYAALLALVAWVGGLIALGALAAPATFDVVAARQLPDGRLLAGAIVGEMLRASISSPTSAASSCRSLSACAVLGPRPRRPRCGRAGGRDAGGGRLFGAGGVAADRTAADDRIAPSSLPEGDPRRVEFGRLHGPSSGVCSCRAWRSAAALLRAQGLNERVDDVQDYGAHKRSPRRSARRATADARRRRRSAR